MLPHAMLYAMNFALLIASRGWSRTNDQQINSPTLNH
jgi:hypothetical protein